MHCNSTPDTQPRLAIVRRAGRARAGSILGWAALAIVATVMTSAVQAAPPAPLFKRFVTAKDGGQPPTKSQGAAAATPEPEKLRVVAVVNREEIHRDELAKECLRHYGTEVLEALVNKHLIVDYCRQQNVTITRKEVEDEIDRVARKFSLPTDQWLKMLEKERNVKPKQYANDVIWPTLALRKLAASQLKISKAELDEGYESQFGPAVKVRLISLADAKAAREVHALVTAKPDEFGVVARKRSIDANSASANGLVQPIRRHLGEKQLEDAAFMLREGEISPIIQVGSQFVILKCEGHVPASAVDREHVDPLLIDALKERKLRAAGTDLFKKLQEAAVVENIMNDPVKSQQMPGVAALLNKRPITLQELAEECIDRHGTDVLDGTVNRHLIEQTLRKNKLEVTQKDIDAEIARAALSMGRTKRSGEPDVEGWIDLMTRQQGISLDVYVRDAVWPSVALKKIVGDAVIINDDDLRKGFEANFGPRVRCRAVVLASLRKAQEVWEKARQNPTAEYFGKLAEEYSIEANSRALRGEVPPIQKFGGQPQLEKEAFSLQNGEMSGIVQTGATYVILFCEGRTEPEKIDFKEVRGDIKNDLHEKKLRMAMARKFEEIKDAAEIDNFLAGTMHSSKNAAGKPFEDPNVRSASAQGKPRAGGRPPGAVRNPDMSIDELIKATPDP